MRRFISALAVALLVTSGCSSGTTTLTPRESASESDSEPTSITEEFVENSSLADSPDESDAAAGESSPATVELGDRSNPAPLGTSIQISDDSGEKRWEVTLVATNLNATDEIMKENQFNASPEAGRQYAQATFRVKYVGAEKGFPGSDLSIAFVSSEGTTHKSSDSFVLGPNELSSLNELYTGGEEEGNVFIAIPTVGASEGTWRLSHSFANGEYFFKAQ